MAEQELKVEHNGSDTTFPDLHISIDKGKFSYKMFEKQDTFNCYVVRMA